MSQTPIMKTILCATDFSKNSDLAFQYCLSIATKIKARVILFHAWDSPVAFTEMPMTGIVDAERQIREGVEKKLSALKKFASENFHSVPVETIIEQGFASDLIMKFADELKADLIVIGASGTGKIERMVMGSTASKVIQHANCPVLCIPKGVKFKELEKIVFATDLHEDNLNAAVGITDFAKLFHAEIVFLFVDNKHLIHSDESISEMTKKIRERLKYPKISGYICKNTDVTDGIEYFLKRHPADLLAMLTHKKKIAERIFHPSITREMIGKSSLPILVLERSERVLIS